MHPIILGPPHSPARMTEQQAISVVKRKYGYPADMPDSIWHTTYGTYERPAPGIDAVDVWAVSSTGAELADYFIPGQPSPYPPIRTFTAYIDDKARGIFLVRISDT